MQSPGATTYDAGEAVATAQAGTPAPTCDHCGDVIERPRTNQRFCSEKRKPCRTQHWEALHPRVAPTHTARKAAGSLKRALFALMVDGYWRTVQQLAEATGGLPATVSARLRPTSDLSRHAKAQGYRIMRDHLVGNGHVQHRYRLAPVEKAAA